MSKSRQFFVLNHRGSSLIQVLIAAGIMGIIALTVATMVSSQNQGVSVVEDRLSKTALNAELIEVLSNPAQCTALFQGLRLTPANPQARRRIQFTLRDRAGVVLFDPQVRTPQLFDQLRITNAYLENINIDPASSGTARVVVDVNRQRSGGGPKDLKAIALNTSLEVDNTLTVTRCLSGAGSANCLDYAGTHPGDVRTIQVPADVKVISINLSGGSNPNPQDGAAMWGAVLGGPSQAVLYLGTTTVSGQILQPGGSLSMHQSGVGGRALHWRYNGLNVAYLDNRNCYLQNECSPWVSYVVPASVGATCPTAWAASDAHGLAGRAYFYK